ncbi:MAG: hypothetical protein KF745_03925 [Phycisphaeraceae bacterium]|nr:hypothetical protein [Phycisphaeraceae bacterium]
MSEPGDAAAVLGGPGQDEPSTPQSSRCRRVLSVLGFGVGLLLIGAAVLAVAREGDAWTIARESITRAPRLELAMLLLLPVCNWLVTSAVFWVLTRRYGRVGFGEMSALIGAAWLLNMLPLRPGLIGRVTYHKTVNRIRIRDSAKVLALSMGCTVLGAVAVLGVAMVPHGSVMASAGIVAAPVFILLAVAWATSWIWRNGTGGEFVGWRTWVAGLLRYLDVLLWAVRYWLAFRVIGAPISPAGAAIVAAASQAAMAVPVQVGVREWIVGVAAAGLPRAIFAGKEAGVGVSAATPGLLADLLNRACELLVVIPVGVGCLAWLCGRSGKPRVP